MGKNDSESFNCNVKSLIALGSNLDFSGDGPLVVLDQAFEALELQGFVIRSRSRFYDTPAFPAGAGPNFVNAAAVLESDFEPRDVLRRLHAVEEQMGRMRAERWGARTLDLDLIAVGQNVLPDPKAHKYWRELPSDAQQEIAPSELILPHPRLAERGFVLVPLLDVAPDWVHPITKLTVRQMHDALPQASRDEVIAL